MDPVTIILLLILLSGLLAAAVLWPRQGLRARWRHWRAGRQRIRAENALKHLYSAAWQGSPATLHSLAGALHLTYNAAARLTEQLAQQGWLASREGGLHLTADGERYAIEVVRAHRLWERYLVDEARMPLEAVHAQAERLEHNRPAGAVQALEAALGHPSLDPHGDPIPTADGRVADRDQTPLTDWPVDTPARIAHLEDEPAVIYSQIVAEGLRPGSVVRVVEANAQRVVLSDGEQVHTLAPLVAANVYVTADGLPPPEAGTAPLTELRAGQAAQIEQLDQGLQGLTRRRLLDLGVTPGTVITAEMVSLFGDPRAYRVRGTLIALRREQAEKVTIRDIRPATEAVR